MDRLGWSETRAQLLHKLGRSAEAADVYRGLIKRNPENRKHYLDLLTCLSLTDPLVFFLFFLLIILFFFFSICSR